MTHARQSSLKKGYVDWGFDLTDVKSDEDFLKLLKKYGLVEVRSQPPTEWMKGRFTKGITKFANKDGFMLTVEHMGGKGSDKGALGYIGIKIPAKHYPTLSNFLKDFRGDKVMPMDVYQKSPPKGIATYVKEESPYESGFIGVDE